MEGESHTWKVGQAGRPMVQATPRGQSAPEREAKTGLRGRSMAHLLNLLGRRDRLGDGLQALHHVVDGHLDPLAHVCGVEARGHRVEPLDGDGTGEHGGAGGAVAGGVVGLVGNILDQLRAEILLLVLQLDSLGDLSAVTGCRPRKETTAAQLGPRKATRR